MGAKQSKRSVDISGKEAESAGEVAAAGAGGEGRVEALADVDALKPQANGAAHIHEQTDKEKELDSGTPENEKDATTEKESKEEEGSKAEEKEAPVTNGEAEAKPENGEPSPATEEGKKPKKEKVKKKWSLRSISFSRKDKPKQEKKQKEEEPKTNGEPEKVPEEAAEVTPENAANEVAEEAKPEAVKEEKTPETPVTEPLTNGSSTPESAKEDASPAEPARPEPAPAPVQPEQLPVNGLSLEEQKSDAPEAQSEETKPEEPAADKTEPAPAPEIPVKKEVCVEQVPVESTPPPLPANPPPSSVASFAATTMAPELTAAASLPNTADLHLPPPETDTTPAPVAPADIADNNTETAATELPPPLKEPVAAPPAEPAHEHPVVEKVTESTPAPAEQLLPEIEKKEPAVQNVETKSENVEQVVDKVEPEIKETESPIEKLEPVVEKETQESQPEIIQVQSKVDSGAEQGIEKTDEIMVSSVTASSDSCPESNVDTFETVKNQIVTQDTALLKEPSDKLESLEAEMPPAPVPEDLQIPEPAADMPDTVEDLPPPPPPIEEEVLAGKITENVEANAHETNDNSNHITDDIELNGLNTEQLNGNVNTEKENVKNKSKDSLGKVIAAPPPPPCNGTEQQDAAPRAETPQEPIPVSDKLADLIPEVPVVPELNTQTETSSDVAVAN